MKINVYHHYDDDSNTLMVDGRPVILRESFAVVDRVADHLRQGTREIGTEIGELVDSIRRWLEVYGADR